jgi:hypothetical protein
MGTSVWPLSSARVIVAGSVIVGRLLLRRVVMAAAWRRGVSGVLLLLLPAVLAELRIAGAVEELDQGMTSVRPSIQTVLCPLFFSVVVAQRMIFVCM